MVEVLRSTAFPLGNDRDDGLAGEPSEEFQRKTPGIMRAAEGSPALIDSRKNVGQKAKNNRQELSLILELTLALERG